ncbi:MAG: hypothetical protein LBE92_01200 [Chryseobacterium sp.]|jgi:hypothetical protein|uniref:hypothetical protein n=1 Tax=Chryseobacterium sp. TaxID=1871047 RepID=UPI00283194A1|nr:hypothetical protein [Chryseobacterium sp.]MDR2234715.1 hypothetical protein [Chryseobacterium sp.]
MSLDILNNPLLGRPANSLFNTDEPSVLKSPSELKQLTARQIANTYYEGKAALSSDGFQIYTDDPIFGGNIEEVVIYQSMYRKAIGEIDVILFASKDGAFLLQRYMEALPNSNQLILFLEINDQYNYSTVMRAVAGAELTRNKKNSFDDILAFTRKHQVSVSPKAFEELIKNEIYRNKVSFISWFLGLKDASIGKIFTFFKQELLEGAADFFIEGIADNIAKLRISENGWNPYPKEGEYEPVFIPDTLYKELKKFYEHEGKRNPYENLEGQKKINAQIVKSLFERIDDVKTSFNNLLTNAETFFPDFIYKRIKKSLNFFFSQIGKIESFLIDPLTGMQHIIYRSHQMTNAFLCGVYNSLIDIVAGIFSIIGFIFKAVAAMDRVNDRKVEYGEMFLELTEDLMEGIMNFDYLEFFKQCLTFQIRTVFRLVKWIEEKVPQITFEKASYYYGYIIGIIVDIIVETLLTGGAAAVARLAKTVEGFILNPLERISKAITHAGNFMTRILEFIKMILREFKKGTKEIFSKLEKVLDEVFGFGDEVADYGMTSAERRVKEKKRRNQEQFERKNDPVRRKRIKQHEDFVKKWSEKPIKSLAKIEIANALKGFTEQGNRIAKLIEEEKIIIHILDEDDYIKLCMEYGDTLERATNTYAFTDGLDMYFSSSRQPDVFLSEIIHEGTHAKDTLEIMIMLKNGKTDEEIMAVFGDNWSSEKRAFFHEHAWQRATGMKPDFDTVKAMLDNIFTNYEKH